LLLHFFGNSVKSYLSTRSFKHSLLLKQSRQVRLDLCSKELGPRYWIVRSLRNLSSQVLAVTWEENLEKVLEVQVTIIV